MIGRILHGLRTGRRGLEVRLLLIGGGFGVGVLEGEGMITILVDNMLRLSGRPRRLKSGVLVLLASG